MNSTANSSILAQGLAFWPSAGRLVVADVVNDQLLLEKTSSAQLPSTTAIFSETQIQSWHANRSVQLQGSRGVAPGPADSLLVADTFDHCIRKFEKVGQVTVLAGICGKPGWATAALPIVAATRSRLFFPASVAFDEQTDSLLIADTSNHCVRVVNLQTGVISVLVGQLGPNGIGTGYSGDGTTPW